MYLRMILLGNMIMFGFFRQFRQPVPFRLISIVSFRFVFATVSRNTKFREIGHFLREKRNSFCFHREISLETLTSAKLAPSYVCEIDVKYVEYLLPRVFLYCRKHVVKALVKSHKNYFILYS